MRVALDFEKLNRVAISIGITVPPKEETKTNDALKKLPEVKMPWRTYGVRSLIITVVCKKGEGGNTIDKMRRTFEELNVISFDICIGFAWEKVT